MDQPRQRVIHPKWYNTTLRQVGSRACGGNSCAAARLSRSSLCCAAISSPLCQLGTVPTGRAIRRMCSPPRRLCPSYCSRVQIPIGSIMPRLTLYPFSCSMLLSSFVLLLLCSSPSPSLSSSSSSNKTVNIRTIKVRGIFYVPNPQTKEPARIKVFTFHREKMSDLVRP